MRKTIWTPTLAWIAAALSALVLAVAAPSELSVMGRLPSLKAKRLDQQPISLPSGLAANRTLALIAFHSSQRGEIDSWIEGMHLNQDRAIAWIRMPVLEDPGSARTRGEIENRLLERHISNGERARLVPVFTDREAFTRAAGLSGTEHASVLVVNRHGTVLARAEGLFDEEKGRALRETLLARGND